MNKRKFFRAALGYCLLLPLASCSEDEEIIVPPDPVSYTTLVYMAADNSMDSEVDYTISQLRQGARRSAGTAVSMWTGKVKRRACSVSRSKAGKSR